jgi:membrane-associated phospholipid phosphatase
VSALLLVASLLADRWVFRRVAVPDVYGSDLGRLLRVAGYLPTWLLGAAAFMLHDRARRPAPVGGPWRRGALLALAPVLGGLGAEGLKLLLRRERPGAHDGAWVFRPFLERPFDTGGLGLPSSHAMVAFAGASMAAALLPRTAPVWLLWAAGCAATRVLTQAHFTSDVVVAGIAGALVTQLLLLAVARRDAATAAG